MAGDTSPGTCCRACGGASGQIVLDLGSQPACDYFPSATEPGPDPRYPLAMWLCAGCGLAQLRDDATTPQEPRGVEPRALTEQAADAVARVSAAGLFGGKRSVAEFGSPHGGSWLPLLAARGLSPLPPAASAPADVVVDCFGLMHEPDQNAGIRERADRMAPGGVLLVQYHSLSAIVRQGQWNALRHGHYAYYSAPALTALLARAGLTPFAAWRFDLYGGTVLLAAARDPAEQSAAVRELLAAEAAVTGPDRLSGLGQDAAGQAAALRAWLDSRPAPVYGYGAASRAVALLSMAGADRRSLTAVADAAAAKRGRRMPGTDIPIISPRALAAADPASILLFLPDLLPELEAAFPALASRWLLPQNL